MTPEWENKLRIAASNPNTPINAHCLIEILDALDMGRRWKNEAAKTLFNYGRLMGETFKECDALRARLAEAREIIMQSTAARHIASAEWVDRRRRWLEEANA